MCYNTNYQKKRCIFIKTTKELSYMGITIETDINYIDTPRHLKVIKDGVAIYDFEGLCKIVGLDESSIIIVEKTTDEIPYRGITIITKSENEIAIDKIPVPENKNIELTPELQNIKKIILPIGNRFVIYSYEFGFITSAAYDTIIHNKVDNQFSVTYRLNTIHGKLSLFGTLDADGHLIDDTLYSPLLKKGFLVDEHKLAKSLEKYQKKIEKLLEKRKIDQEMYDFYAYECDLYLSKKRKRKNNHK